MSKPLKQTSTPPNFNGLAHIYRWMEVACFGPWLQRCRCAFLETLSDCRRGLAIGDGDGRFTAELLRVNRLISVDAVDASEAMLGELLHNAGAHANRVNVMCVDARRLQAEGPPYDLVVTHFFLDCLTTSEVESLAFTLRASLSTSARWIISEFAIPSGWYGQLIARPLIRILYWVFGLLTGLKVHSLPKYRDALKRSGFEMVAERKLLGGLLVSEVWAIRR
jgi:hypothetical protein